MIGRRRRARAFERVRQEILAEFDRETAAHKTPAQLELEKIMARRAREDREWAEERALAR